MLIKFEMYTNLVAPIKQLFKCGHFVLLEILNGYYYNLKNVTNMFRYFLPIYHGFDQSN